MASVPASFTASNLKIPLLWETRDGNSAKLGKLGTKLGKLGNSGQTGRFLFRLGGTGGRNRGTAGKFPPILKIASHL